jgi:hypothetical protein
MPHYWCVQSFHQAADTPFITGPIAEKIGPFADNEYSCNAVLDGTIDFEGISEIMEVHDLINGMRFPDPSNPTLTIDVCIGVDTFVRVH